MNGQFIAKQMPALGRFDRVDVADNICDGHIRRCKFFDKAAVAMYPVDSSFIAVQIDTLPAICAQRPKGIVVDLRAGYDRDLVVKQLGQLPDDATLCLAAKP